MYKSVFYHIILVVSVLIFSCAGKNNSKQPDNELFNVCKIVIVSPYGCYQEIEIDNKGYGALKSGLRSEDITDKDVSLDTLFGVDSFYVQNGQDLRGIHRITKSILENAEIKGGPKDDAYRCKFFIDGVNKIDIYGINKDVHELLTYIINYLPLSNDKCEFFELFKKSMHLLNPQN